MASDWRKNASEWYYNNVFRDEAIRPRPAAPREQLPPLLQAARSLEGGNWQSREAVFLKQGKLLAEYEEDTAVECNVFHYYPTYQSLSDRELRWYFTWRTLLRRGEVRKTSLSCAFLYIYELINLIGVDDATDAYWRLKEFYRVYGELDGSIRPYLRTWLTDFVVCYDLPATLLKDTEEYCFDQALLTLEAAPESTDAAILDALSVAAPGWLKRSKFYQSNQARMNRILAGVIRDIAEHHRRRTKKTIAEQFFATRRTYPVRLFATAVTKANTGTENRVYQVNPARIYECKGGLWTVTRFACPEAPSKKLEALTKSVDAIAREMLGCKKAIACPEQPKWIVTIIRSQVQSLLDAEKAEEAKRIHIDRSILSSIRSDAAFTRDRLIVEEEAMEEEPEEVEAAAPTAPEEHPEATQLPLSEPEYRLMQCLLYGGELSWVRREGHILSVLVDGINDKLYDVFSDSVLLPDEPPELIEDYIDELKGMIHP